jgi:DnaJ-class molecular chaperone
VTAAVQQLPEQDALELMGLRADSTREALRAQWHEAARRYHPDKAAGEAQRVEFHYRFLAYQAAYERLSAAFEAGRLPRK